jgi:hypothetical protein
MARMHARWLGWLGSARWARRVATATAGARRGPIDSSARVRARKHKAVGPATLTDAWFTP